MTPFNSRFSFNIEDQINDIVQNVLGDFVDSAGIAEALHGIIGAIETPNENHPQEAHVDEVVAEIIESMSLQVSCGYALPGGYAPSPELKPVESTATSERGPLGNAVQDVEEENMPAKGEEVFNMFGELIGWLVPEATPPAQRAPLRRNSSLSATWRRVRRVVRGLWSFRD